MSTRLHKLNSPLLTVFTISITGWLMEDSQQAEHEILVRTETSLYRWNRCFNRARGGKRSSIFIVHIIERRPVCPEYSSVLDPREFHPLPQTLTLSTLQFFNRGWRINACTCNVKVSRHMDLAASYCYEGFSPSPHRVDAWLKCTICFICIITAQTTSFTSKTDNNDGKPKKYRKYG